MRKDVKELIEHFHVKTFGNVKNLEMLESEIKSGEKPLYIAPTNIKIRKRTDTKAESMPGVLFVSNLRVVFRFGIGRVEIREFPLLNISSVSSKGNGITGGYVSFYTEDVHVDFLTSYNKDIYSEIETVLYTAIEQAVRLFNDNEFAYDPAGQYAAVTCPGCGALNIVKSGIIRACEYCGRPQNAVLRQ